MKFLLIALVALFALPTFASTIHPYVCQTETVIRQEYANLKVTIGHMEKGTVVEADVRDVKRPAKQGHPPAYGSLVSKECKKTEVNEYTCNWKPKKSEKDSKVESWTLKVKMTASGLAPVGVTFITNYHVDRRPISVDLPCKSKLR